MPNQPLPEVSCLLIGETPAFLNSPYIDTGQQNIISDFLVLIQPLLNVIMEILVCFEVFMSAGEFMIDPSFFWIEVTGFGADSDAKLPLPGAWTAGWMSQAVGTLAEPWWVDIRSVVPSGVGTETQALLQKHSSWVQRFLDSRWKLHLLIENRFKKQTKDAAIWQEYQICLLREGSFSITPACYCLLLSMESFYNLAFRELGWAAKKNRGNHSFMSHPFLPFMLLGISPCVSLSQIPFNYVASKRK